MMKNLEKMSEYLSQAILLEVCAHPKPGLVTRHANGSHHDMSIVTFAMSSIIVSQAFYHLLDIGKEHDGDAKSLFAKVRQAGIEAEKSLLTATKGINTQRGILFAGGILVAAAGYLSKQENRKAENICDVVAEMTQGLVKYELQNLDSRKKPTAGEFLYQKYQITGIRGEVEHGFKSVRNTGLPSLKAAFANGAAINDALVHTLIALMTCVEDSNVIWRTNYETLGVVQEKSKDILKKGSVFTIAGRNEIEKFDHFCRENRISPGGAADLLSITIGLFLLENKEFPTSII
jgi:triphosphoribosyl-dephospho-CoA synthase CitG